MKKGFTLIELLVVIAIIAILSAIIFPVFARAKASAYRSSDMSNMNSIRTGLQLYRADQESYPPVLLGYINPYTESGSTVIPANLVIGALYPKLIDSISTLQPAMDQSTNGASSIKLATSTAVWPAQLNNLQAFGPSQEVMGCYPQAGNADNPQPNQYYLVSGYDVATVPIPSGLTQTELHYTLFWSVNATPTDPCNPSGDSPPRVGSASDTPRQLGYANPPETTVVTWDSYFRDPLVGGSSLPTNKGDIVLFLGGSARPYPSNIIGTQSWQATP